jgi:lipid II:glycine glycyltransferase (peptidoglycan interpeptide bridge formation enzyme)
MSQHIVQSPIWGEFKEKYGTPSIRVGNIQYTKHKIPFSNNYYAYCPRVNPFEIDFDKLKESAEKNDCINVNFDVPNVIKGTQEASNATEILKNECVQAPKDQFAKGNVLLDITKSEEELLSNMHKKHRYNIKYAQRKGVTVKEAQNDQDFETFYNLFDITNKRQKYYGRSHLYLKNLWGMFYKQEKAKILTAYLNEEPLASWMFFIHEDVIYYPYGGSSEAHRNLFGSNLVAWEGIKLGKKMGCKTFDMWGTAIDPEDKEDPYYGFTNFKMKFGGKHVVYIDSYDLVLNTAMYNMFNTANNIRWKLLKILR